MSDVSDTTCHCGRVEGDGVTWAACEAPWHIGFEWEHAECTGFSSDQIERWAEEGITYFCADDETSEDGNGKEEFHDASEQTDQEGSNETDETLSEYVDDQDGEENRAADGEDEDTRCETNDAEQAEMVAAHLQDAESSAEYAENLEDPGAQNVENGVAHGEDEDAHGETDDAERVEMLQNVGFNAESLEERDDVDGQNVDNGAQYDNAGELNETYETEQAIAAPNQQNVETHRTYQGTTARLPWTLESIDQQEAILAQQLGPQEARRIINNCVRGYHGFHRFEERPNVDIANANPLVNNRPATSPEREGQNESNTTDTQPDPLTSDDAPVNDNQAANTSINDVQHATPVDSLTANDVLETAVLPPQTDSLLRNDAPANDNRSAATPFTDVQHAPPLALPAINNFEEGALPAVLPAGTNIEAAAFGLSAADISHLFEEENTRFADAMWTAQNETAVQESINPREVEMPRRLSNIDPEFQRMIDEAYEGLNIPTEASDNNGNIRTDDSSMFERLPVPQHRLPMPHLEEPQRTRVIQRQLPEPHVQNASQSQVRPSQVAPYQAQAPGVQESGDYQGRYSYRSYDAQQNQRSNVPGARRNWASIQNEPSPYRAQDFSDPFPALTTAQGQVLRHSAQLPRADLERMEMPPPPRPANFTREQYPDLPMPRVRQSSRRQQDAAVVSPPRLDNSSGVVYPQLPVPQARHSLRQQQDAALMPPPPRPQNAGQAQAPTGRPSLDGVEDLESDSEEGEEGEGGQQPVKKRKPQRPWALDWDFMTDVMVRSIDDPSHRGWCGADHYRLASDELYKAIQYRRGEDSVKTWWNRDGRILAEEKLGRSLEERRPTKDGSARQPRNSCRPSKRKLPEEDHGDDDDGNGNGRVTKRGRLGSAGS
ncbi:MAG: hypothetical protein LQ340_003793 [Diploschistes diacapsis]|nr:MAG: hypothetical protein LQ340_003793 [Diploschistes diacapsis]